jgi:imidazolonepropionase-like amidohydrolase
MHAYRWLACLACLGAAALCGPSVASAQDVAITNVRVIVGDGTVIDSGTVIVRGGRISSVSAGATSTLGLNGDAVGVEAGYTIVNARTIWDEGGALGYCTDTGYDPRAGLEHELQSYNVTFSMQDIFKLMGPNTAAYINMADDLGTLEAGKLADIVLLAGDPLEGYWNMLDARVVLKGGVVVVDKR